MGKAGRWIRNLLFGKREDTNNNSDQKRTSSTTNVPSSNPADMSCTSGGTRINAASMSPAYTTTTTTSSNRKQWSFRRSTSSTSSATTTTSTTARKSSRSFDSIFIPNHHFFLECCHTFGAHAAAATKIQATYRSYLARRALRALRGLVKLQALARGYLVRKHMNSVVRSIHAAMAIQVRARISRLQSSGVVTEQPTLSVLTLHQGRRRSSSSSVVEKSNSTGDGMSSMPRTISRGCLRSRSGRAGHRSSLSTSELASVEYNGRERQLMNILAWPASPSTFTDSSNSSTTFDAQPLYYSSNWPQNRHAPITHPLPHNDHTPSHSHFPPNYMNNTSSSKAKARSHSEPRQRPKLGAKQKSRPSSFIDQDSRNKYPSRNWLIPFEPPVNLY